MDKYLILKNPLVLTFDKDDNVGYYNIVIKNNLIHEIDFNNELISDRNIYTRFPGVNIIDAKNKIVIPAFFNSNLNSSFALSGVFFERLHYDKISDNLSLVLLEKYFTNPDNKGDLKNLILFSFFRALSNGEVFVNETSAYLSKEFIQENSKFNFLLVQDVVYTAYTEAFNKYLTELKKFHCVSVRDESVMNNYSLTAIAKAIKEGRKKVFFEVLQKSSGYAELLRSGKNSFSKSLFDILAENDLLNSKVIFSNPIHMQKSELDYLSGKNVNVVLCPSDILKLADRKPENYDFLKYGLNVSIGTGYTGKSVLSELKLFSHLAKKGSISYLALLKMAIINPSITFNVSETHGSIEKNKIANLVLFDINDLRNYFIHPEATSEKVAEHILENFDSKDISDVIIKGNIIRRDHRSKLFDADTMRQNTLELAGKIFETGKYYEFKEKYLMRKRIKELSINNKEEKEMIVNAAESAVDESVYQDTAIISDSEFRIIGIQKNINDINTEGTQGIRQNEAFSVFELESLDKGFNLFNEPIELTPSLKKSSEKTVVEKSSAKPNVVFRRISADQSDEEDKSELQPKKSSEAQLPTEKITPLKKSNLRFGFSDEE